ncbi:type II toxin-antitoxin system RelE/ParE family toxin [uncultured Cocleimonas sp.]|uniref:type II toxin-antitoxin system RelE/ParE family toxin n=1 Tax=uncultured Cocleimonas sp. TaxID=1051587 RepID=UPI00261C9B9B|nr:type II toxin-antitoxin system RelE/ParE family toxin [uncultured Cocleimonas sp.]
MSNKELPNKALIWLPEAKDDISRLHEFLKSKNPEAATRMVNLLLTGADRLIDFPEIGKPIGDELKRRELFLAFGAGAYVIRYILTENSIVVIRVWHSREMR